MTNKTNWRRISTEEAVQRLLDRLRELEKHIHPPPLVLEPKAWHVVYLIPEEEATDDDYEHPDTKSWAWNAEDVVGWMWSGDIYRPVIFSNEADGLVDPADLLEGRAWTVTGPSGSNLQACKDLIPTAVQLKRDRDRIAETLEAHARENNADDR